MAAYGGVQHVRVDVVTHAPCRRSVGVCNSRANMWMCYWQSTWSLMLRVYCPESKSRHLDAEESVPGRKGVLCGERNGAVQMGVRSTSC